MASMSDLRSAAVTLIETALGSGTRATSDYTLDGVIPAGKTVGYQLRLNQVAIDTRGDSNEGWKVARVDVVVYRRIDPGAGSGTPITAESACVDLLHADQGALLSTAAWEALSTAIYDIPSASRPEITEPIERISDELMAFVLSVVARLKP